MHLRTTALLTLTWLVSTARTPAEDGADFFEKRVRPLLAERCFECHSPEKKVKGGLRLDVREGWAKGGDTGPAIEPGKLDESLLITAVRYHDKDLQMPPKKKLSEAEVATLEEWVRLGAPDPRTGAGAVAKKQTGLTIEEGRKFWAYIAPKKCEPPAVKDAAWPRGDIDRFILAKLEEKGLQPVGDAAPEVLARRLCYALVGLPPTREQAACSVEQLVDELLGSPHFGEAWGRHWLDVARFAESSGGGRTLLFKDAWRYRDYVIEAFNSDRPFDQFLREQIAGDLLPAGDPGQRSRQLTATAFLALGPTNYEEQDKQQLRFDIIDEQLDTIGKAVLGQTIGCARCHDHKFDPIPQRDYYALAGIFASTRTLANYTDNVARWVDAPLSMDGEQEEKLRAHETRLAAMKADLDAAKNNLAALRKNAGPAAPLPGIIVDDAEATAVGEWKESHYPNNIGVGSKHDMNADKGRKTLTFLPKLPASGRYEVRLAYPAFANRSPRVPVQIFHADGEETVFVNQTQPPPIDELFVSLGKFRFEKDGAGFVLVSNEGTTGYVGADAVQFLPEEETAPVAVANQSDAGKKMEARVKQVEGAMKKLASTGPRRPVAMAVRDEEEVADTNIRVRGLVNQKGALVPRGVLQVALAAELPALSEKESGRRELADWLASPGNPLTARVFVNRVWSWLFGAGLVRTTENFGTTGEAPSHPELLDWLAIHFVEEGWSVKKLVREIVLSRAWQLGNAERGTRSAESKRMDAADLPRSEDPDNRLLAHANRRRLDAEQLRDSILTVSGELRLEVGGSNITGAGEINANDTSSQNTEYKYEFTDTRRSVYTPAFRNKRLELFEVFDFANINAPVGHRDVSTVAPQALYLLNHPFIVEQSKLAAARALASSSTDAERLAEAFRAALGRAATDAERATCEKFLAGADADRERRTEGWSQLYQSLFGCLDFRYLE